MRNVLTVLQKEFQEITRQRGLMVGILVPAVILTIVALTAIVGSGEAGVGSIGRGTTSSFPALAGFTASEAAQALIGMQISVVFLMMPTLLTSIIAAYAIIGEKTNRTLEPLLATPIRTWELLVGKALAAIIPGVGITWLSGSIFLLGLSHAAVSDRVVAAIASPGWYVTFLLWTPLLAIVAIGLIIILSSRVSDPRAAQQLSSAVVLPFLVMMLGQASGWIVLGPRVAVTIAGVLVILATGCLVGAVRLFQRDVILTRWK